MLHTIKRYTLVVVAVVAVAMVGVGASLVQDTKDTKDNNKKSTDAQKNSEAQKSKSTAKPNAGTTAKKPASDPDKVSDERMSTRGMHRPPKDKTDSAANKPNDDKSQK